MYFGIWQWSQWSIHHTLPCRTRILHTGTCAHTRAHSHTTPACCSCSSNLSSKVKGWFIVISNETASIRSSWIVRQVGHQGFIFRSVRTKRKWRPLLSSRRVENTSWALPLVYLSVLLLVQTQQAGFVSSTVSSEDLRRPCEAGALISCSRWDWLQ